MRALPNGGAGSRFSGSLPSRRTVSAGHCLVVLALAAVALTGCGSSPLRGDQTRPPPPPMADGPPARVPAVASLGDAVPQVLPLCRACARPYTVAGRRYVPLADARGYRERGIATWYGRKFHGRPTASGEPFDMLAMTAAHRTLPLPSYARVTNLGNGRSVIVKVNDRGPFKNDRLLDLSYAAALKLGMVEQGTARVLVETVGPGSEQVATPVSVKADPAGGYVQVGAFHNADNARRLLQRLVGSGIEPVSVTRRPGDPAHRVVVGPLPGEALAATTERLAALGLRGQLLPPTPTGATR